VTPSEFRNYAWSEARFPFKRNRLRWQVANHGCHCFDRAFLLAGACVCCVKISDNKRKRQPIGMLGRISGNHDWLLANASACVSCSFRLRNACNASDCVWMETGLEKNSSTVPAIERYISRLSTNIGRVWQQICIASCSRNVTDKRNWHTVQLQHVCSLQLVLSWYRYSRV